MDHTFHRRVLFAKVGHKQEGRAIVDHERLVFEEELCLPKKKIFFFLSLFLKWVAFKAYVFDKDVAHDRVVVPLEDARLENFEELRVQLQKVFSVGHAQEDLLVGQRASGLQRSDKVFHEGLKARDVVLLGLEKLFYDTLAHKSLSLGFPQLDIFLI